MHEIIVWRAIAIVHEQRKYTGSYAFLRSMRVVKVRTLKGERIASVDTSIIEERAKALLSEMAKNGMA